MKKNWKGKAKISRPNTQIGLIQLKKLGMNKTREITRNLQKPVKRWFKIIGKKKKNIFLILFQQHPVHYFAVF